jgi:hypothetical protein
VSDLTDEVVAQLNITSFPALLAIRYNFKENKYELHRYPGKDFHPRDYEDIKKFL